MEENCKFQKLRENLKIKTLKSVFLIIMLKNVKLYNFHILNIDVNV